MQWIDPRLQPLLGDDPWRAASAIQGEVLRNMPSRRTLRFVHAGRTHYLKQHLGVGWGEIFKNWLTGKRPVTSALDEFRGLERLRQRDVPSMGVLAIWCEGRNPARRRSFIITDGIENHLDLGNLMIHWGHRFPSSTARFVLTRALGELTRDMFAVGVNHRDYYLCHMLIPRHWQQQPDTPPRITLIDLHRAEVRERVPRRQQLRDLSGLYSSCLDFRPSLTDIARFQRHLLGEQWKQQVRARPRFWHRVNRRARRIYNSDRAG